MNVTIRKLKSRFRFSRKIKQRGHGFSGVLIFVLIIAVLFFGISVLETRLRPAVAAMAETRARNIATREIHLTVIEKLSGVDGSAAISYNDIVEIDQSESGSIEAIRTNIQLVNLLQSELMVRINERIWQISAHDISIPAGNLSGLQILMGRGPNIPIRLVPVGDAEVEMLHNFTSAGINQTRHQILLEITTNIEILIPTGNTYVQVITQIPVAETIIVGSVPDTYMNVGGNFGLLGGM